MIIGIKKLENGLLFLDKCRYNIVFPRNKMGSTNRVYTDKELSQSPYNYTKVEIDDKYSDCQASDFNDDLTFSIEKYNARKQALANEEYENKIVALIRKKYNVNQELAILRQREVKPQEFAEYNEYVEQCKKQVKNVYNYEEVLANAVNQESEQEGA